MICDYINRRKDVMEFRLFRFRTSAERLVSVSSQPVRTKPHPAMSRHAMPHLDLAPLCSELFSKFSSPPKITSPRFKLVKLHHQLPPSRWPGLVFLPCFFSSSSPLLSLFSLNASMPLILLILCARALLVTAGRECTT